MLRKFYTLVMGEIYKQTIFSFIIAILYNSSARWYEGGKKAMKFTIPGIWQEPTDHTSNCYLCMVDPSKHRTGKTAPAIMYLAKPSIIHCPSAIQP